MLGTGTSVHVQRSVQLSQPCAFGSQLRFLWEGSLSFGSGCINLLPDGRKVLCCSCQPLGNLRNGVIKTCDVASRIVADLHRMRNSAVQCKHEFVDEGIKLYAHGQSAIGAKLDRCALGGILAGCEDGFARFFLVHDQLVAHSHAHEILLRERMRLNGGNVLLESSDELRIPLNLLRKVFEQLIFQPELLALVVGLHQPQTCHVHIQIHFFP